MRTLLIVVLLVAFQSLVALAQPPVSLFFAEPSTFIGGVDTNTLNIDLCFLSTCNNVSFTDQLPAGLTYVLPPSNNGCTGADFSGSTATELMVKGIFLRGSVDGCTISVMILANQVGSSLTNSITDLSYQDPVSGKLITISGVVASTTLTTLAPPLVTKKFIGGPFGGGSGGPLLFGAYTTLHFTITNTNNVPLNQIAFDDPLPMNDHAFQGLVVQTPNGLDNSCSGANVSAPEGGTVISVSNVSLPANRSCDVYVNVKGTAYGTLINKTTRINADGVADVGEPAGDFLVVVSGGIQSRYLSNLNIGDSVINISNSGASGASLQSGTTSAITGAICANVYAFTPDEQLVSCCSCPVTPNGLVSLSAKSDLTGNTLTPVIPTALTITLLATLPAAGSCNNSAAAITTAATLAPGMVAWGTTIHATAAAGTYGVSETPFSNATPNDGALNRLSQLCNFIIANGSGYGQCKSCRLGGLGSALQ